MERPHQRYATMPLVPIGESTGGGGRTPRNGQRRERERIRSKERRNIDNDDGADDDILALLESTKPGSNSNSSDSSLEPSTESRHGSSSNNGKQSALRDRSYGSTTRKSRVDSDAGVGSQKQEDGTSTKKVRFAAGDKAVPKASTMGLEGGKPSPGILSESARRTRPSQPSQPSNDNWSRSSPSLSTSKDVDCTALSNSRRFESTKARDIGRPIPSYSDNNGRLQKRENGDSTMLETKRRHEEKIQTLKRRHEEEIKSIVADHRSQLERSKEKEGDAATLSNFFGPISESAHLLQTLKDEWMESKATTDRESSRLAAEAEKKFEMVRESSKEEATLLKDAVKTLHVVTDNLQSQSIEERKQLEAERSRLESLQVCMNIS